MNKPIQYTMPKDLDMLSYDMRYQSLKAFICLKTSSAIIKALKTEIINFSTMTVTANVTNSEIWENNKKYAVYKVVVNCDDKTWVLYRRYNEFSKLCDLIKKQCPWLSKDLKLPGKKLFGNNFSTEFMKTRRKGLDTLVQTMLAEPRKGNLDFKNIDPEFTREAIPASVCKSHGMSVGSSLPDNAFQGFSYAPPIELNGR
ncbi:unnamed protein product [Medioppia subpectinata]|uniref:PX domain-containing protein n=1 Tax=Medioppia subpectinata TaxID=1979941 RepID=A0A7R9KUI8_9ACAR|nr:unnamed protein product [Medioppia subpectinata]CAG2109964.1 unnamed protein product [Medioppia subpectinata]